MEEGDLKVAMDTFGDASDSKFNIDEMLPKSLSDFEYFGAQVGLKLKRHEVSGWMDGWMDREMEGLGIP